MKVQVVASDPDWPRAFAAEAKALRCALGAVIVDIHHIGSTSIPGIFAKPIIDLLLEVSELEGLDTRTPSLASLGYEALGEFGIPGRRYFRKNSPGGSRTHQIHAFATGSFGIERHLAFRDYMITHPAIAESYSVLKQRLAAGHPHDLEAYINGKRGFVEEHEARALAWKRTGAPARANGHAHNSGITLKADAYSQERYAIGATSGETPSGDHHA